MRRSTTGPPGTDLPSRSATWGPVWHFRLTAHPFASFGARPAARCLPAEVKLIPGGNILSLDTPRRALRNGDRISTVAPSARARQLASPARTRNSSRDAGPRHLQPFSPSFPGEQLLPTTDALHAKTPALIQQHHGRAMDPRHPARSTFRPIPRGGRVIRDRPR